MKISSIKQKYKTISAWCGMLTICLSLMADLSATTYYGYGLEQIENGFQYPDGMSCRTSTGDVYFADRNADTISKIPAGSSTATTIVSGLNSPSAICVDSSGNIYFSELGGPGAIKKWLAGDSSISTLVSGVNSPQNGMALDSDGNLYYSSAGDNNIYKITSGGSVSTLSTGLNLPVGVCVDNLGYVYIAEWNSGDIRKISTTTGGAGSVYASGLSYPYGICRDSAGNLYISGYQDGNIKKILASDHSVITIADSVENPTGMCLDSSDVLYFAQAGGAGTISKLATSSPPTINLTVDFTNGAVMSGSVTGGIIFTGNSSSDVCTFNGSAIGDVQVTKGKVSMSSNTPIASGKSMRLNGGDLIATAGFELPTVAMDQAGTLNVNTNSQVGLAKLTGSNALTIATSSSSTGSVHLEDLSGNSGGIAACSQSSQIDGSTKFPSAACFFQGDATVGALPGQASSSNLTFGNVDSTAVNIPASGLTSAVMYATKINIGTKNWSQNVTAVFALG